MQHAAPFYPWFACAFCVAFTLRSAFAFAQRDADIFLALCVYDGQFATLIVYYSEFPQPNALLPAISGYFAAIAGFLIVRAHHRKSGRHPISSGEEAVVLLLLLIALPRALVSPDGQYGLFPSLDERAIEVLVTLVLDTIGFYALYRAVSVSQGKHNVRRRVLSAPLVLYWALNTTFSCIQLYHLWLGTSFAMPVAFQNIFAVIKIITVLTFVPAVLAHDFFKYKWPRRLMVFLHLSAVD